MKFSRREVRDLLVAWLALGLAFTFLIERPVGGLQDPTGVQIPRLVSTMALSLATVGVAFLLHELAHKVVAVRFGQVAEFRADYGMLFLAVAGGLAGFLFAAPGAVHHRGRITKRENGLIALAGPVTNLVLAAVFLPFALVAPRVGVFGIAINLLLAGFNMLPVGPLDGRTVLDWSVAVYLLVFVPSAALAALVLFTPGLLLA